MKLVQGVGINDMPKGSATYRDENNKQVMHSYYRKWIDMISRCYDLKHQQRNPTYIGCTVSEEWKRLSNFKKWFDQQPVERHSWQLDKDLLCQDNKVYSPEACILVPHWLNSFVTESDAIRGKYMIGVYWLHRNQKYQAKVCDGTGKQKHLGLFTDELSAHLAWKSAKLNLVEEMKSNLDAIDTRLYPALIKRYS